VGGEELCPVKSVWVLTHQRVGDRQQMAALVHALGWPAVVKKLVFRGPNLPFLANWLLDREKSDPLEAPWPDLVLCAEARTSVIARRIRDRSQGKVKIVCLGRPSGTPENFDLVITTAQYRLPKKPQVVELDLPLISTVPTDGQAPLTQLTPDDLRRPLIVVLIGGASPPDRLDDRVAATMAQQLQGYATSKGGTLLFVTSPRTPSKPAEALARLIPDPHRVHVWKPDDSNDYPGFLASADEIIVTSDSVSMAAEAVATGKPVRIFRLPQYWTLRHRVIDGLYERTAANRPCPLWLRPFKYLFDLGLIEPRPRRDLFFNRLAEQRVLQWVDQPRPVQHREPGDGAAQAAKLVRRLLA
jgi:mitochondrial fission protein ELM1